MVTFGKAATGATNEIAEVTFGAVMVIVCVVVLAHSPAVGVKVYVVVVVLFNAGDHVPVIALLEVVGKAVNVALAQEDATVVNVGVTIGFTVMVIVAVFAHNPAVGVKVYVVVIVLFTAGDHVPITPFVDVVGKAANVAPAQIGATCVNVGVVLGVTVTKTAFLVLSQVPTVCDA